VPISDQWMDPGDEGVDTFLGDLRGGLTIWQAKAFPNGVHKSQQDQIRKSLKTARKLKPKKWIFCLSVDMDIKAHRWFQYLKKMVQQDANHNSRQIIWALWCRS